MSLIIVVSWPEMSASLVRRRLSRYRIVDEIPEIGTTLPADWLDAADEIRVAVGAELMFRALIMTNLSYASALEAARYAAEPLLPVPIEDLEISLLPGERSGRDRRYLISAIGATRLAEIIERVNSLIPVVAKEPADKKKAKIPITWIGPAVLAVPPGESGTRSRRWAAVAGEGRWTDIQCARSGEAAADALARRHADLEIDWDESSVSGEQVAVARAGSMGGWRIGPPRQREKILRHWPSLLTAASILLAVVSVGLHVAAADHRISAAQREIADSFADALPGSRLVSPSEQIGSAFADTRRRYDELLNRVAKRGSALEIMSVVEAIGREETIVFDDIRISDKQFVLVGTAAGVEAVQIVTQQLQDFSAPASGGKSGIVVETRQTARGRGTEFTVRGNRK